MTDGMANFISDRLIAWQEMGQAADPERLVEAAGRVCYMSFGLRQFRKENKAYIENLVSQGHESVLEHASFSLLVDGLSRSLSHQLVRHRAGFSYSQLSQQYYDESFVEFSEPHGLSNFPEARRRWNESMKYARDAYREILDAVEKEEESAEQLSAKERLRLKRNIARSVLPNATVTTLMVTGNARAWRHLLNIRGDIPGDPEMREYCVGVFELLRVSAPSLFGDFEVHRDQAGLSVRLTGLPK